MRLPVLGALLLDFRLFFCGTAGLRFSGLKPCVMAKAEKFGRAPDRANLYIGALAINTHAAAAAV